MFYGNFVAVVFVDWMFWVVLRIWVYCGLVCVCVCFRLVVAVLVTLVVSVAPRIGCLALVFVSVGLRFVFCMLYSGWWVCVQMLVGVVYLGWFCVCIAFVLRVFLAGGLGGMVSVFVGCFGLLVFGCCFCVNCWLRFWVFSWLRVCVWFWCDGLNFPDALDLAIF